MLTNVTKLAVALTTLCFSYQALAHGHHDHGKPLSEAEIKAAGGEFADADVKDRPLSDWEGVWQSVYPLLKSGALEPVLKMKAEKDKSKTLAGLREYYTTGYASDIDGLGIENGTIEFRRGDKTSACHYDYDGYKILHYVSGKKGVRYLFKCTEAGSSAPKFVQFSDHIIGPRKSAHFHIYSGNTSQEALFTQLENWPTFYPYQLTDAQVVDEMLHH